MKKLNKNLIEITVVIAFLFGLTGLNIAYAATAPVLGTTSTYGIVSSTSTNSNTALQTIVNGKVCGTTLTAPRPLTITGGEGSCPGGIEADQATALNTLATQVPCTAIDGVLNGVIINGQAPGRFPPGCYEVTGAMTITTGTTVTLDSTATGGDGGDVWVFRTIAGGSFTTGASTAGHPSVVLAGTASAANVFWAPAAATSLGANFEASATPTFIGTIIDNAGIGLGLFVNLSGRALAFGGTVTTNANTITVPNVDITPPTITIDSNKTVLKKGEVAAITFTLSEVATDFIATDVTVAGGLLSAFAGSGTSYTATFTPTDNSTTLATIDVATSKFTDPAGNPNTAATQKTMTVDTIAPTVTIGSDKIALTKGQTAAITFTLSEVATDFTAGDVSVTGGALSAFAGSGTSYTAIFTPTDNSTTLATIDVATSKFTGFRRKSQHCRYSKDDDR